MISERRKSERRKRVMGSFLEKHYSSFVHQLLLENFYNPPELIRGCSPIAEVTRTLERLNSRILNDSPNGPSCKLEIKGCVGKEPVGEKMLFEIILIDGKGNKYVAEFLINNRNIKMMNMAIQKMIPICLPKEDIKLNKDLRVKVKSEKLKS
jgi:hypothetical protein